MNKDKQEKRCKQITEVKNFFWLCVLHRCCSKEYTIYIYNQKNVRSWSIYSVAMSYITFQRISTCMTQFLELIRLYFSLTRPLYTISFRLISTCHNDSYSNYRIHKLQSIYTNKTSKNHERIMIQPFVENQSLCTCSWPTSIWSSPLKEPLLAKIGTLHSNMDPGFS
jgi:hypothetical protein